MSLTRLSGWKSSRSLSSLGGMGKRSSSLSRSSLSLFKVGREDRSGRKDDNCDEGDDDDDDDNDGGNNNIYLNNKIDKSNSGFRPVCSLPNKENTTSLDEQQKVHVNRHRISNAYDKIKRQIAIKESNSNTNTNTNINSNGNDSTNNISSSLSDNNDKNRDFSRSSSTTSTSNIEVTSFSASFASDGDEKDDTDEDGEGKKMQQSLLGFYRKYNLSMLEDKEMDDEISMAFGVRTDDASTITCPLNDTNDAGVDIDLSTPTPMKRSIFFNDIVQLNYVDSFKHELSTKEKEQCWYTDVEMVIMKIDGGVFDNTAGTNAQNQQQKQQQEEEEARQRQHRASTGTLTKAEKKRAKEMRKKYGIDKKVKKNCSQPTGSRKSIGRDTATLRRSATTESGSSAKSGSSSAFKLRKKYKIDKKLKLKAISQSSTSVTALLGTLTTTHSADETTTKKKKKGLSFFFGKKKK